MSKKEQQKRNWLNYMNGYYRYSKYLEIKQQIQDEK